MQGRNENILTSSEKILALKDKLKLWKTNIYKTILTSITYYTIM